MTTRALAALRRKLDTQALEQLRAIAAAQAEEIERKDATISELRGLLAHAEDVAESWRQDALDMQLEACRQRDAMPGITRSGHLVVVARAGAA